MVLLGAVDPHMLAAANVEGQIIARVDGDEAFARYWRRPDADEKALHDGWYFSGDTGYFDPEGDLFITGRVDDMIISGGENISPVELESILSLHPRVREVAVVGLPDPPWGQRVTAFVKRAPQEGLRADQAPEGQVGRLQGGDKARPGEAPGSEREDAWELDQHCLASSLADFKRPRDYIFVAEIPKSPVGKILRRLLVAGDYVHESSTP